MWPVVAAGDAGSACNLLNQGGGGAYSLQRRAWGIELEYRSSNHQLEVYSFGFSGSGLLIVCAVASLIRPPEPGVCRSHPVTAVPWVDVAEVTTIELRPALSISPRVEMSVASARPSLSLSWSSSIFLTRYSPVAILALSGGATATATKRGWEAGTLGFTSPEIIAVSFKKRQLYVNLNL